MQIVAHIENPKHLELLIMLFEQLQISDYTITDENDIYAPFTDEQVQKLNESQKSITMHPFTCMGTFCDRGKAENEGILIATNQGWICPCGQYTQNYARKFNF
jgi:hypothetical protein